MSLNSGMECTAEVSGCSWTGSGLESWLKLTEDAEPNESLRADGDDRRGEPEKNLFPCSR